MAIQEAISAALSGTLPAVEERVVSVLSRVRPAESINEYINGFISDWTLTFKIAAPFVAVVIIVLTGIVSKGSVPKIAIAVIFGGILVWAVTANGVGWFSDRVDGETKASPAQVLVVDDDGTEYGLAA